MAKTNINPIQWYEGMLLMPQHFQQADIRIGNLLSYYMHYAFPYYWGILYLKIDEALLTSGTFRPLELEAIMPDGLIISGLPTNNDASLEINLDSLKNQLQKTPQYIYLCVPPQKSQDEHPTEEVSRYISSLSSQVVDINTGEQPIKIPLLEPNLSLQVGSEPPAHYICFPIAQVKYGAKSFSLTDYLPPQPKIDVSMGIGAMCNQLSEQLRLKLAYLQQKVQTVQSKTVKDSFFEEIEQVRLKLIAGLLPFEVLLSSQAASPLQLFRELCSLAGQISGVKYGESPPRFQAYNHLDLHSTFDEVIKYIKKVLDEIQESYTIIPFTLRNHIFKLQLESSWVGDRLVLGAKAAAGMKTEALINWINNCIIVTEGNVTLARDNRVLGANRTIVSDVPSLNLIATSDIQLFIMDVDPRYIDPKSTLYIFNISDNEEERPAELVLYNSNQQALEGIS
ncbi:MAG: type VI secretion system baseplate subunit TssK [Alphaproteobacteria bacterium]|nr:type VI secretion system baseplate subunit TssK [Alphaproteobacteria bacterium]